MSSVAEPGATYRSEHKRRVNDLIHDSLHDQWDSEPAAFFCECPAVRCFESVWLSGSDYRSSRLDVEWSVLAPGHRYTERSRPAANGSKRTVSR